MSCTMLCLHESVARVDEVVGAFGLADEVDDVAWCQRQHQHLLDMGGERVALDRSVDHAGGIDVVGP